MKHKYCQPTTKILLAALLLSLSVLLPTQSLAAETVKVVLDWSINTNHTGIVVADKKGYFAEQNLTLELLSPPQTGGASLLGGNKVDLAISFQEEITIARSRGVPLVAVATIIQHNTSGFASPAKLGITRPRDISGKRYGGWGGDVELAILKTLVETDGGDYSTVKVFPLGDTDLFAAMQNHIDVVWVFEGWDNIAAKQKNIAINYIPLNTVAALDYYTPVIITNQHSLDNRREHIRKAIHAISKGYSFAIRNPKEAAQLLLAYAPELDRKLVIESQQFLADHYQAEAPRWGEMKLSVWENFANWLKQNKLLDEGAFEADKAYTNDLLPEANVF